MKIARESWALIAICILDLVTTIYLVHKYDAIEANSVMRYYLNLGVVPFILAKMVLVAAPIAVLEWARRRRPQFVRSMLRCAIALYILMYAGGVWKLNGHAEAEQDQAILESVTAWAAEPTTPHQVMKSQAGVLAITPTVP